MNDTTKKDESCKKCGATEGTRHLGYCFANPENNYRMPDATKKDELFGDEFECSIYSLSELEELIDLGWNTELEQEAFRYVPQLVTALRSAHEKLESVKTRVASLQERYNNLSDWALDARDKVKELESQLRAKDAEIERYKKVVDAAKFSIEIGACTVKLCEAMAAFKASQDKEKNN